MTPNIHIRREKKTQTHVREIRVLRYIVSPLLFLKIGIQILSSIFTRP